MNDPKDWVHELRAARQNQEVEVIVNDPSGEEATKKIRNEKVAYTNTIHPRTRNLAQMGFVKIKRLSEEEIEAFFDAYEEDEIEDEDLQGEETPPLVEEPTLVPTGDEVNETKSDPDRFFTTEELLQLKKGELVSLAGMFPDMEINTKQNKDLLQEEMLKFNIPWVDPELLEG